jgi:hypothetical protein
MAVLIQCRPTLDGEVPTTPARIAKTASTSGWKVATTYAKAEQDGRVLESIALRLARDPLAGYGLWVNGKFDMAYVWSRFTPLRKVGARTLAAYVKPGGER